MSDRILCHARSANPEGNLEPDNEYVVGPDGQVSEPRARSLVSAGQAEWIGRSDAPETATTGTGAETAIESEFETATEEPPSGTGGDVRVEQSGSWFTIYVDGEQVDKVQGAEARDAVLDELE